MHTERLSFYHVAGAIFTSRRAKSFHCKLQSGENVSICFKKFIKSSKI